MIPLVFKQIGLADAVIEKRYLARIKDVGFIFGNWNGDGFSSDCDDDWETDCWSSSDVVALYEIPEEVAP